MHTIFIFIDLIFLILFFVALTILKIKCLKNKKISNDLVGFISKSSEILTRYEKKQESIQLRNSIKLYSLIRIILKIINPDYISFFKYEYNNYNVQNLNFLFSIDGDGMALQNSHLEKHSVISTIFTLFSLKKHDEELNHIYTDEIKDETDEFYQILLKRNIKKVYFKNIYNTKDEPIGFIMLSYKNKDAVISEDDKNDILKNIDDTKYFI